MKKWKKTKTWAWHRSSLHVDHMPTLWGLAFGTTWRMGPCLKERTWSGREKSTLHPIASKRTNWRGVRQKKQKNHEQISMKILVAPFLFPGMFFFSRPPRVFCSPQVFPSHGEHPPKKKRKKYHQGFAHKVSPPGTQTKCKQEVGCFFCYLCIYSVLKVEKNKPGAETNGWWMRRPPYLKPSPPTYPPIFSRTLTGKRDRVGIAQEPNLLNQRVWRLKSIWLLVVECIQ